MARKPSVRFFESRNAYYTQIGGHQIKLGDGPDDFDHKRLKDHGPNYIAAKDRWLQLLHANNIDVAKGENTVRTLCNAFVEAGKGTLRKTTVDLRLYYLTPLVQDYGELRVSELIPYHLHQVIARMRKPRPHGKVKSRLTKWEDGTVRGFISSVQAMLNWALVSGLIEKNPCKGVKRPSGRTKARERILTPQEFFAVLGALNRGRSANLRRLVIALENTGARPGELTNAKVSDWDDKLGAVVYYGNDKRRVDEHAHKSSFRDKDRTIRFTGAALDMVRELVQRKRPGALLFTTWNGTKYSPMTLGNALKKVARRTGLKHLVPYCFRHTLATNWLKAGGNIDVLAEILGNTPDTIRKHYSHLCKEHEAIRAQLEAFRRNCPHG